MATRLTKRISRVVETRHEGPLVVTLTAEGVYLRRKGTRTTYGPLAYGKLFLDGARLYAIETKRAKAEAKKLRRIIREAETD